MLRFYRKSGTATPSSEYYFCSCGNWCKGLLSRISNRLLGRSYHSAAHYWSRDSPTLGSMILRRAKTPKVSVWRLNGEKNRLSLVTIEANRRRLGEEPF